MGVELRGRALISIILLASGLDFLLFGYDQGLFGGILAGKRFTEMLGNPSPTLTGLVTGVYDIGCAIGAVTAFIWGESIGRKRSIIFANFIGTGSFQKCSAVCRGLTVRSDHRSGNPDCLLLLRANARLPDHSRVRGGLFHRRRANLAVGDVTVPQSRLSARRSVWTDHHWRRCRLVALLRHAVRQQQHAVSPHATSEI